MTDPITIFTGSTGLNIVASPTRIETTDLQVAVNVSIDQSGRVQSRRGVTQLQEGNYHSLFCDGGDCFVVSGDTLYQVAVDGSLSVVRSGLTPAKMAYAQVGDRTYYTNGYELGVLQGSISSVWKKGVYTGPETNRVFDGPVPGRHLAEFSGRMFISQGNAIWWSELFDFGLYDRARSFVQFHTNVRMMKPVDAGMFISTERNTYFLAGKNPKDWALRKVTGYPAVEWTDSIEYVNAADLGIETVGLCPVWASTEGAILGTPDGIAYNLNKNKIIYPETAKTGFGGMFGYNFIHGVK